MNIYQADAFSDKPFSGNPAAVVLLDRSVDAAWMQNIAREMNLSETAFLRKQADGYHLRWFTPAVEVALCGHATLASAHILWESGLLPESEPAHFHTLSGVLTANRCGDEIELDFPATPPEPADAPEDLAMALGCVPQYVGRSQFDYLIEVDSEAEVRLMHPDHARLRQIPVRGIMVTAPADQGYDFVSRFFAPGSGIDEDPVTGSAHCCLGPYWGDRLNKTEMLAYQASSRGGVVRVRLAGNRVILAGKAATIFKGELSEGVLHV